jgi:nitrate reductase NapD
MPLAEPVIDRRSFISGRIAETDRVVAPPGAEIASVLVQARPDRLAEVEAAILAIGGCEIHARDPKGKLVVVIEAANAGALGATLTAIALLPSVFSASLVFHAIDAAASGESS